MTPAPADDEDLIREKMAIDKGLGLSRVRNTEQIKNRPHLYDDTEEVFRLLSSRLGGVRLTEVLDASSDEQIISARNELRGLLTLAMFATASSAKGLKGKFGLKVFAKFADISQVKIHRLFLLYFLALKEDAAFLQNLAGSWKQCARLSCPSLNPTKSTLFGAETPHSHR